MGPESKLKNLIFIFLIRSFVFMEMKNRAVYNVVRYLIALVWFINGLFCKILNLVPRHQEIVDRMLNFSDSRFLTVLIGISEIIMVIWILSGFKPKLNAITQILVVLLMNILEIWLTPDLLMWGRTNFIFALLFILIVYWNEFVIKSRLT